MLKKHSKFFSNLLFLSDLILLTTSWLLSYALRFSSGLIPLTGAGVAPLSTYLYFLPLIYIIWGISFRAFGLYRPRRMGSKLNEVVDITKASLFAFLVIVAASFFLREVGLSRTTLVIFSIINIVLLSIERAAFREFLRYIRKKGHNLRTTLVAGTGKAARETIERLTSHPELGIKVAGLVAGDPKEVGRKVAGHTVIGLYADTRRIVVEQTIDHVILALGLNDHHEMSELLRSLVDESIEIKVVPDVYELVTLGGGSEDFYGIPLVSIQSTPLYGWNSVLKRAEDIAISSAAIIISAPLMGVIAVLVKATSQGPVLYRQKRMSFGGETFEMLKFRSMRAGSENAGPVFTEKNDERTTGFGRILRRMSLDELPQLFNVLRGEMSLVGPRPELPEHIERLRKEIPGYMLRHNIKAGITGWAQANDLRGLSDRKIRTEYDLYYIRNWSIWFDLKILILTLLRVFFHKTAH